MRGTHEVTALFLIIQVFFHGFADDKPSPDKAISCHFINIPLIEFCDSIQKSTGVNIYYRTDWVDSIKISIDRENISVIDAVVEVTKPANLEVYRWHDGLVIIPAGALKTQVALFEEEPVTARIAGMKADTLTLSEERYITGRKADAAIVITVGSRMAPAGKSSVTILGRITDRDSGEPVIGATMYLEEPGTGTASDQDGYLSMKVMPGNYTATFEFMGMEKLTCGLNVLSEGQFSVEMKKTIIQMKEVVVYGDRQMDIQLKEPGLEKITTKTIKEIPMLLGERDILKVSEMLPGIVSVGEGSAGLNVRGGNFDQNAFYINRIPIYSTSHVFGFFPAFNADIIKDFSIYKGYIPASYGGRLSSMFNIIGRQGNRKKFTARGGISPVAANLVVEGPIRKDTSSFIVSGRYLYSDWILGQVDDPMIRNSTAGFMDFSASLNRSFKKGQLSWFAYYSNDDFELSDLNSYTYSNLGSSLIYSHNFSTSFRSEFAVTAAGYSFSTIDRQEVSNAYEQSYSIGDYEASADFKLELNEKNALEFGAGMIYYRLDRGTVDPYGENSLRIPVNLGMEQAMENSVYISDEYRVLPWITVSAGLRLTLFNPIGEKEVYTYAPGGPKDIRYITDTLEYGPGESIKWYFEPEIRAAVNFRTDENGSVKVAFNQMHQNIFMLNNTIAISPNSQWKLADYHIRPASCNQVSAGVFRNLPAWGWEASAELYYKYTRNATEFADGADFLGAAPVETTVLQGKQSAYGIELMLRRSGRRLEGWLAYTWSRSIVKVDGDQPWEDINEGVAYPSNYDIPNVINTVVNYHFSRRVTASGILTYQTGKPVTYPVSIYYVNGIPVVDYAARNSYRIPDYFRVDLSLTIEGNLRRKKWLHNSVSFSVYNVTGRDNPYSVYFKLENGRISSYQYSVIGVPIFTVTWLFKLGNYASD